MIRVLIPVNKENVKKLLKSYTCISGCKANNNKNKREKKPVFKVRLKLPKKKSTKASGGINPSI